MMTVIVILNGQAIITNRMITIILGPTVIIMTTKRNEASTIDRLSPTLITSLSIKTGAITIGRLATDSLGGVLKSVTDIELRKVSVAETMVESLHMSLL
jgi:hypothetical protein